MQNMHDEKGQEQSYDKIDKNYEGGRVYTFSRYERKRKNALMQHRKSNIARRNNMKRKESEIKMDYIEPNMEVIWLDAKEDVIRTSNPGLKPGEGYEDEDRFDDTFGGL